MKHETAVIDPTAVVGEDTHLGAFTVIGPGVRIGARCRIGHHVVVHEGTRIGDDVRIDDHAVLGKLPMKARLSMMTSERILDPLEIGDASIIGTAAILYRGARLEEGVMAADGATIREDVRIGPSTIIGRGAAIENRVRIGSRVKVESNAYICAYSQIDDGCFIAPCVATSNDNYAGRDPERVNHYAGVTVERGGRIGIHATILPGRTIGADALVAGGSLVSRDVAPGRIVIGSPARDQREVPSRQLLDNQ